MREKFEKKMREEYEKRGGEEFEKKLKEYMELGDSEGDEYWVMSRLGEDFKLYWKGGK